jgi:hypothetical protein
MPKNARLLLICLWGALLMGLVGIAQDGPTEAPAGFDTPTLNPNQSHSNGIQNLFLVTPLLSTKHALKSKKITRLD